MPWASQLRELGGDVAPGEDAGVDRVVEGLDLAADVGLALGQVGDRGDLDAVRGEVLARAVGREDLDVERRGGRARGRRCRLGSPLTAGLAPGAFLRFPWGLAARQRGGPWVPGRSRWRRTIRAEYTA